MQCGDGRAPFRLKAYSHSKRMRDRRTIPDDAEDVAAQDLYALLPV